ncbi:MAG: GAF domain-containing protein [Flavobacteriaceae bacterium]
MFTSIHMPILNEIKVALEASHTDVFNGLEQCCSILRNRIDYYDWVGFYFADFSKKNLHLKAFSGTPTEHVSIPFGKGICGQVAVSNQNFMVPDVQAQDNYIACSLEVRSELVVPLFFEGKNIGQIDIDSHKKNPFSKEDEQLLVNCCDLISKTYGSELLRL